MYANIQNCTELIALRAFAFANPTYTRVFPRSTFSVDGFSRVRQIKSGINRTIKQERRVARGGRG